MMKKDDQQKQSRRFKDAAKSCPAPLARWSMLRACERLTSPARKLSRRHARWIHDVTFFCRRLRILLIMVDTDGVLRGRLRSGLCLICSWPCLRLLRCACRRCVI